MKILSRIALLALGLTVSTAVSAEQVDLKQLQCVATPPTEGTADVVCPTPVNGLVTLEQCTCPENFLLVNLSAPGAITPAGLSPG